MIDFLPMINDDIIKRIQYIIMRDLDTVIMKSKNHLHKLALLLMLMLLLLLLLISYIIFY